MKKVIKLIVVIFTILLGYICVNSAIIYNYLREYGYGINELPKTVAVWMRVSAGFTVAESDNADFFIGRSYSGYYKKMCEKKGYYVEQMGRDMTATNSQKRYESIYFGPDIDVWCHWFRLYEICSDDGKITIDEFRKLE